MVCVELKTAEEVRAHARMVARRMIAQRFVAPKPPEPPIAPEPPMLPAAPAPIAHDLPPPAARTMPLGQASRVRVALRAAAEHYSLPMSRLLGPERYPSLIRPRHIAFFVARRLGASFKQIGRVANRDHSTVLHGYRTIHGWLEQGHLPELADVVDEIGSRAAAIAGRAWPPVAEAKCDERS